MCGLSGLVQRSWNDAAARGFVAASRLYLRERGIDDFQERRICDQVVLTHARLSIIDTEGGGQPMEHGGSWIVYNGEVYNYKDLKDPSASYRTRSDTEVLLRGVQRHGAGYLNRVDGMFAFAQCDLKRRKITLARDFFGIKPLYYIFDGHTFAFASRIPPLMLFSRKEVDPVGLAEYYLGRACKAPRTLFRDIVEVRPGEVVIFDLDSFEIRTSEPWVRPVETPERHENEAAAVEKLDEALRLAVKRHLVSDVPVATFLSGGVDSSLVTALAAIQQPDISALSIGFKDSRFDEAPYAAAVCRRYGLRHHVEYCDAADFLPMLDEWPMVMDDPVADPSAVMLHVVARLTRALGYKVVLSGEGADELFAGYNQYWRFQLARSIHAKGGRYAPMLVKLVEALKPGQTRYAQFARAATVDPRFHGAGIIFEPYLIDTVIDASAVETGTAGNLHEALELDIGRRLPDDILTRTDRATMHASVEARVPFLTRYVLAEALALPDGMLVKGGVQKYALRKVAERYVPRECMTRPKNGFDLPLADWLRADLREKVRDLLASSWQRDYLRPEAMKRVVDDHMAGRNDNADKIFAFMLAEENVRRMRSISLEAMVPLEGVA